MPDVLYLSFVISSVVPLLRSAAIMVFAITNCFGHEVESASLTGSHFLCSDTSCTTNRGHLKLHPWYKSMRMHDNFSTRFRRQVKCHIIQRGYFLIRCGLTCWHVICFTYVLFVKANRLRYASFCNPAYERKNQFANPFLHLYSKELIAKMSDCRLIFSVAAVLLRSFTERFHLSQITIWFVRAIVGTHNADMNFKPD